MTIKVSHATLSEKPQTPTPGIISANEWNADHIVTGAKESDIQFNSVTGHNHDGANSTKAALCTLSDEAIQVRDKINNDFHYASVQPISGEIPIIDSGFTINIRTYPVIKNVVGTNSNFIGTLYNNLCKNCYYDGTDWKYITSGYAERVELGTGQLVYYISTISGTAGAIVSSWTTNSITAGNVPPGTITAYGGISVQPTGWLFCDGNDYPTTGIYTNLYNAILFNYGNNGANFKVPDLRNKFPYGKNTVSTANYLSGGSTTVTLTEATIPQHSHTYNTWPANSGYQVGGAGYASGLSSPVANTSSYGGSQPHDNMPPFITVNYIIKL